MVRPIERRIVDADVFEKVFRPLGCFDRLQDDGVTLPPDRYGACLKAELIRKAYHLTSTRFSYFDSFQEWDSDG